MTPAHPAHRGPAIGSRDSRPSSFPAESRLRAPTEHRWRRRRVNPSYLVRGGPESRRHGGGEPCPARGVFLEPTSRLVSGSTWRGAGCRSPPIRRDQSLVLEAIDRIERGGTSSASRSDGYGAAPRSRAGAEGRSPEQQIEGARQQPGGHRCHVSLLFTATVPISWSSKFCSTLHRGRRGKTYGAMGWTGTRHGWTSRVRSQRRHRAEVHYGIAPRGPMTWSIVRSPDTGTGPTAPPRVSCGSPWYARAS